MTMNEILGFRNTVGNHQTAELHIKKEADIDLIPFFKDVFKENDLITLSDEEFADNNCNHPYRMPERWYETDAEAVMEFRVEEFFQAMFRRFEPTDVADFLQPQLADQNDYHNEAMLERIRNFYDIYGSVTLRYDKSHFALNPERNTDVSEIESIVKPRFNHNTATREFYTFLNKGTEEGARNTTRPYHRSMLLEVKARLYNNEKPILTLTGAPGTRLDFYSIITRYDLPTNHLEIRRKPQASEDKISQSR